MSNQHLFQHKPASGPRRNQKRPWALLFGSLAVVVFIGLVIYFAQVSFRVYRGVQTGVQAAERAKQAAMTFSFEEAGEALSESQQGLEQAQSGLEQVGWLSVVPWIGPQVQGGTLALQAGVKALFVAKDVTAVLERAEQAVGPMEDGMQFEDLNEQQREALILAIAHSAPELQRIRTGVHLIARDLARIEALDVPGPIGEVVDPLVGLAPQAEAFMDFVVPVASALPEFTGAPSDRQWLLLYLNNTEMRPGGGFMGVYGLMLMRQGEVEALHVDDTYAVDRLVAGNSAYVEPAPEPILLYTPVSQWYFRDANWSPDFAESANSAVRLLQKESRIAGQPVPEVHNVVGFTPSYVEDVLGLIGSVNAQGFTFTEQNVTALLEEQVEFGYEDFGIPKEDRKQIVELLTHEVIASIRRQDLATIFQLLQVTLQNIEEKQIAFYSIDASTQAVLEDAHWAGRVDQRGADDVLAVVDANMLALKTDPAVERETHYAIQPSEQGYIATVTLTYRHDGTVDPFTTDYKAFTRILVPQGSTLLSSPEGAHIREELGLASFGVYHEVPTGEERTLRFRYELPPSVAEAIAGRVYQLTVLKQMGSQENALTLGLDFGKKVKAAQPEEDEQQFGDTRYDLNTKLIHDSVFTVEF